jgi:outer membrane lipoprotein-sorting protein
MARYRRMHSSIGLTLLLLILLALAACGGEAQQAPSRPTPTPIPTLTAGEQLLKKVATTLNTAKTLHGLFNLKLSGGNMNGTLDFELWSATPDKNRSVVLQSSVTEIPVGSLNVTDGKRVWQYDPGKKVVYTGAVQQNQNGTGSTGGGGSQQLINLVQSIFTRSDGTLKSSSAIVNGRSAYDVSIVPQGSAGTSGTNAFNYEGDIFIDKDTQLPIQVKLNVQGMGNIVLDLPKLELNQPITPNTFTFVVPPGVTEQPLKQDNTGGGSALSLKQAMSQAGYHLLSIPTSQSNYVLQSINALGAPGNQIYTLNYSQGKLSFTIAQGKPLANLPANGGQQISLRGTTATLSSENGTTTLAWTEKGVGIRITGAQNSDQAVAIAKLLV